MLFTFFLHNFYGALGPEGTTYRLYTPLGGPAFAQHDVLPGL